MSWCLIYVPLEGIHPNDYQSDITSCILKRNCLYYHWVSCMWSTWNLDTNSTFTLVPRKTTENLVRVGRSQDRPYANWLLASTPALNKRALTLVPLCAFFSFFRNSYKLFLKYFYLCVIGISTKPCITPTEGMTAYLQKYAYKYTYLCIRDSLIIGNFGNPLHSLEIGYYTRSVAHPISKTTFLNPILLFFLQPLLPSYISTHHLICHFHNKYNCHVQSVHIKRPNTLITPHAVHLSTFYMCPLLHSPYKL
jgi:hypothetical protein